MDNVRTKKRQWRPNRPDDQQPRGRSQIRLTRYDETLKVVVRADSSQRQVIDSQCQRSEPKPARTPVRDRFHWSKPECKQVTANKQQQLPDKSQTKADISQLAGFLKIRSFSDGTVANKTVPTSDVINKTRHACDDKPEYNKNTFSSHLKEYAIAQDSVHCDIKHRTVLGPATKPSCLRANEKAAAEIESELNDDDFDYSLYLMGEYTLKEIDHTKKPTPFWFGSVSVKQPAAPDSDALLKTDQQPSPTVSLDTTCWHSQLFSPEIDLGIVLDTPQDVGEFDTIMTSKRGYTYLNYTRNRGIKRRVAYDEEEEVPIPCKRPRNC